MFKIKLIIFCLFFSLMGFIAPVLASDSSEDVVIDFFYSKTCPVCAKEDIFLKDIEENYSNILINRHDIAEKDAVGLISRFYFDYQVSQDVWGLVPVTFISDHAYLGFGQSTKEAITKQLNLVEQENNIDVNNNVLQDLNGKSINIPFFGEIKTTGLSPLLLSALVGGLDGFNACAMVALGILLTILISTKERKRVVIIGGTFIFISGLVYYIFIATWLNVFLFLGYIRLITYIVSVAIIIFALFLLKDYINGVVCKICKVNPNDQESWLTRVQRYLFARANKVVSSEMPLILMILAVAVVAAGINMIELFCSLGFPLAYTKILSSYNLPISQYYLYLLVYVFFYMIDDFLIFLAAVFTLRITKVSEKYLKFIKLISAVVLLLLGIIMIFKPEILTF